MMSTLIKFQHMLIRTMKPGYVRYLKYSLNQMNISRVVPTWKSRQFTPEYKLVKIRNLPKTLKPKEKQKHTYTKNFFYYFIFTLNFLFFFHLPFLLYYQQFLLLLHYNLLCHYSVSQLSNYQNFVSIFSKFLTIFNKICCLS